jgi:hypothetical protein
MSKRSKKQNNQPAAGDNGGTVTVVDGDAVGVAPGGETAVVETETVEASNDDTAIEATAEPVLDEEVLAMIADDSSDGATTTDAEQPEITAEDVEEPTDDEVLAAIDSAKAPKKSGGKKAAPVVMRDFTAVAAIDEATLKANLDGINAKKVREKADNLIAAIQSGKKLSRYTRDAVEHLKADGRVNGKSIADMFQTKGLSLGTARAQSQQMTALFKAVGLAAQDNGSKDLVLQDNTLADELLKTAVAA